MVAIIREDPAALPDSLWGPLRWTIERCLAKEPAQRYDATRDLFLELRQLGDHASEVTGTAPAVTETAARTRRRWWLPAGALAASLAVGFLLATLWPEAPQTTSGFSLHPDGKSFLTSAVDIKGDIWLLQDFDRRAGLLDQLLPWRNR
jgi:hypothetical protein